MDKMEKEPKQTNRTDHKLENDKSVQVSLNGKVLKEADAYTNEVKKIAWHLINEQSNSFLNHKISPALVDLWLCDSHGLDYTKESVEMNAATIGYRCRVLIRKELEPPVECPECGRAMSYYGYILVGPTTNQQNERVIASIANTQDFKEAFYQKIEDGNPVGGVIEESACKNFERFVTP